MGTNIVDYYQYMAFTKKKKKKKKKPVVSTQRYLYMTLLFFFFFFFFLKCHILIIINYISTHNLYSIYETLKNTNN